jgi:adenosylcobinamide-phosphate synthase
MGWWITRLRGLAEAWAGERPWALRLAGIAITLLLVGCSGLAGWGVEQLALAGLRRGGSWAWAGATLLVLALASGLASRSLEQAVQRVLAALPGSIESEPNQAGSVGESSTQAALQPARRALAWIVGRDTAALDAPQILRAAAETASENAVDGVFAPLFWMLVGAMLWSGPWAWQGTVALPGPLAWSWVFKAASTLDSMLGYRHGRLRWLGTAGARLDDLLVWLPCRCTAASLALVSARPWRAPAVLRLALRDGRADPSPNAGVSQAAYAWVVGVQLGGVNSYGGERRAKPLLAAGQPAPDRAAVGRMLALNRRLIWLWLALAAGPAAVRFITKTLS